VRAAVIIIIIMIAKRTRLTCLAIHPSAWLARATGTGCTHQAKDVSEVCPSTNGTRVIQHVESSFRPVEADAGEDLVSSANVDKPHARPFSRANKSKDCTI
jgi:hypothetical protein